MKKRNNQNIFDMTQTCEQGGKIYERLPNGDYRVLLSDDDYDYVEDKKIIAQLDKIFKKETK